MELPKLKEVCLWNQNIALFLFLFFISISNALPESNNLHSFELIPRDTLRSPHDNLSREAILKARLERGHLRLQALSSAHAAATIATQSKIDSINAPLYPGPYWGVGEYFVRLGVGTPSNIFYMTIDTGSDVTWLQCTPCKNCYKQIDPIFDPSISSTFAPVACESQLCRQLHRPHCDTHNRCIYSVLYGDASFTTGEFSTDTLTFGNTQVKKFPLGCGHDNEGLFEASAGLLGLGRGNLSFPMQTLSQFGGQFSYCMANLSDYPPLKSSSSLVFGPSAVSKRAKFTPLVNGPISSLYYVILNGISVGDHCVPNVTPSVFKVGGGVVVDSGTTITYLYTPAYEALRDAYRKASEWKSSTKGFSILDTCYDIPAHVKNKVTMTLHFDGGADMVLPDVNMLVQVDDAGKTCFAFAASKGISIIGNLQQQGFRVSFDILSKRVGFTPNGCTR